jgi:hypothetical protein
VVSAAYWSTRHLAVASTDHFCKVPFQPNYAPISYHYQGGNPRCHFLPFSSTPVIALLLKRWSAISLFKLPLFHFIRVTACSRLDFCVDTSPILPLLPRAHQLQRLFNFTLNCLYEEIEVNEKERITRNYEILKNSNGVRITTSSANRSRHLCCYHCWSVRIWYVYNLIHSA